MGVETLICLVYRVGKGCRQYPFHSFEDMEKFCSRKPYKNEVLKVFPAQDGCLLESFVSDAGGAVAMLKMALGRVAE